MSTNGLQGVLLSPILFFARYQIHCYLKHRSCLLFIVYFINFSTSIRAITRAEYPIELTSYNKNRASSNYQNLYVIIFFLQTLTF